MSDEIQVVYTDIDNTVEVITITETGPQGPPGQAELIVCNTDIALSGHRFIVLDNDLAIYADCTTIDHAHRIVGMTTGASNLGLVSVQTTGEHEEPSWSWTPGQPVFLSTTGLMTQTPPTSVFSLIVGFPISATKLFIKINQPIILT